MLAVLVEVVLAVLIPDEPDWIRKKIEHIEFTSMQALREQKENQPQCCVEPQRFEISARAHSAYRCAYNAACLHISVPAALTNSHGASAI
ncbi:hypothetical protein F7725_022436 [Dissostichus mawsoni]|uniref:Uncharacterized protein n=1 Tax=Dissostichus mawsoni TaxID=36200 RepID=A0A7J5YZZ5_DISMA|nr:hypothetical protein F7725_022436 [Dissostichus mawsoni]